jgi:hypothetical protein
MKFQHKAVVYGMALVFTALHIITFQQLFEAGVIEQAAANSIADAMSLFILAILAVAVSDALEVALGESDRLSRKWHVLGIVVILPFVNLALEAGLSIWMGIIVGTLPATSIILRADPLPDRLDELEQRLNGVFSS